MSFLKKVLFLYFAVYAFSLQAATPVSIKEETTAHLIDVKYPQGFSDDQINREIKHFIDATKKSFLKETAHDNDIPADTPGKSGLTINYSIPYQLGKALSVRFDVSVYHRGAAHPFNTVTVLNFVKGQRVKLADLFAAGSNYLKPIADLCAKEITSKNISDARWIKEGTQPVSKNYDTWSFTENGLAIIFDSYQVAAYVYGPQTVAIPLSAISPLLKPEIVNTVWKN